MRGLLDDSVLNGTHEARITYRPDRWAIPVPTSDPARVIEAIRYECQLWGGATTPLVPVAHGGSLSPAYASALPGALVDGVHGLHPFDLFDLSSATVKLDERREGFGCQLAVALLEYHKQDTYRPVQVVELREDDPWRGIYAACLGLLPVDPDPDILKHSYLITELQFQDFLRVERVTAEGSFDDLLSRLNSDDFTTPRQLSMTHLPYGAGGSTSLRAGRQVLPDRHFVAKDAGPNILVVCEEGSNDDVALLWNLRATWGDHYQAPIGIPASEATPSHVASILQAPRLSRNGWGPRSLYVTSATIPTDRLAELLGLGDKQEAAIAPYEDLLTLENTSGWVRDEVLVWENGGTRFVPWPADAQREILDRRPFNELARMRADLDVIDAAFPREADVRIDAPNGHFYGGVLSHWNSARHRSDVTEARWPSPLLMARSIASARGLDLEESEPGRASRIALSGLGDITALSYLAHAPLLAMLELMAARQGFGWFKERLRESGREPHPGDAVGASIEELPERSYHDFKRVLGNSEKATRHWLLWAEQTNLVVKGFPIVCSVCAAKQWTPVAAFAPPVVCRGCASQITEPFGDRPNLDFRYRLSERLRRVYAQDAMGHLLTLRFFHWVFYGFKQSMLTGIHPGMNVRRKGSQTIDGEADVLLFDRAGALLPVEVKRSAAGLTAAELEKLDSLAATLRAPWSAAAICEYGRAAAVDVSQQVLRNADGTYRRIVLSYDALLEPHPTWALGQDPFEWKPLSEADISAREGAFVATLERQADSGGFDWLAEAMLRRPEARRTP